MYVFIGENAYSCVYKNKGLKTNNTTFNKAIYCKIFK